MNNVTFNELVEKMVVEEMDAANTKGKEYAHGGDQLDNFKRIGAEVCCPHCGQPVGPLVVLWIYVKKHLDSVLSFIKSGMVRSEPIQGRIMDIRLYMALLRALIEEKPENGPTGTVFLKGDER